MTNKVSCGPLMPQQSTVVTDTDTWGPLGKTYDLTSLLKELSFFFISPSSLSLSSSFFFYTIPRTPTKSIWQADPTEWTAQIILL